VTATEAQRDTPARPRDRRIGELIVDIAIVVGSAYYVWTAQGYPPAGREIPTVVGTIALVVGALQLVGWFVRPLWTMTHGRPPAETQAPAAPAAGARSPEKPVATQDSATDVDAATDGGQARRTQNRDTAIVIAWAAGFLVAILVLGYRYGVPLFFLAYFGARKQWKLAIGSAVVMWALTQFVFIDLLGIALPTSQFFVF
jgi:hypothetical protein